MLTYFFGDISGLAEYVSGTAVALLQNRFSRDLEREADDYSTTKLVELGISPQAFADAMTKLSSDKDEESGFLQRYLSSHPLLEDRVRKALEPRNPD